MLSLGLIHQLVRSVYLEEAILIALRVDRVKYAYFSTKHDTLPLNSELQTRWLFDENQEDQKNVLVSDDGTMRSAKTAVKGA